jgi:RNA polymerase sigma-70 factor, ECF subfamily
MRRSVLAERKSIAKPSGALQRLEAAFSRYSPELYRYVLRRLRRPADAADLTQEIFERFLRSDGLGKARNPQAYLFAIAANVVVDAQLAAGKSLVTYDSQACDALTEVAANPDLDMSERMSLAQELKTALAQLPEMQRAAFLLTKWEGLSIQETALRMNLTEGSVTVYVCEARAKLKALLKSEPVR